MDARYHQVNIFLVSSAKRTRCFCHTKYQLISPRNAKVLKLAHWHSKLTNSACAFPKPRQSIRIPWLLLPASNNRGQNPFQFFRRSVRYDWKGCCTNLSLTLTFVSLISPYRKKFLAYLQMAGES